MKKLLFASDLHGDADCCRALLDAFSREGADTLVILGDILYHGPRNDLPDGYAPKKVIPMLNEISDRIIAVRGNCDAEVDAMVLHFPIMDTVRQIECDGHTFVLSHGHIYSPEDLPNMPHGAVFLYGHTHVQKIEKCCETLCINPGSVTLPKEGNPKTYAIYEDSRIRICKLCGEVISEILL